MNKITKICLFISLTVLLTACGGGGSKSESSENQDQLTDINATFLLFPVSYFQSVYSKSYTLKDKNGKEVGTYRERNSGEISASDLNGSTIGTQVAEVMSVPTYGLDVINNILYRVFPNYVLLQSTTSNGASYTANKMTGIPRNLKVKIGQFGEISTFPYGVMRWALDRGMNGNAKLTLTVTESTNITKRIFTIKPNGERVSVKIDIVNQYGNFVFTSE